MLPIFPSVSLGVSPVVIAFLVKVSPRGRRCRTELASSSVEPWGEVAGEGVPLPWAADE